MPAVPRLSLVTLGVADVARSTKFYESLGWKRSSASVDGDVSFFALAGANLAIWGIDDLMSDALVRAAVPNSFRGVTTAVNCDSRAQVDETIEVARAAGAMVTKPAVETDWGGYSGYFTDPDGHMWEVAHNPHWPIGADGIPRLP